MRHGMSHTWIARCARKIDFRRRIRRTNVYIYPIVTRTREKQRENNKRWNGQNANECFRDRHEHFHCRLCNARWSASQRQPTTALTWNWQRHTKRDYLACVCVCSFYRLTLMPIVATHHSIRSMPYSARNIIFYSLHAQNSRTLHTVHHNWANTLFARCLYFSMEQTYYTTEIRTVFLQR